MTSLEEAPRKRSNPAMAPFAYATFRWIWLASLMSNMALLILGVGAAWAMIQPAADPTDVALVQTAVMLPILILSVPAGAMADMLDRRVAALLGLGVSFVGAAAVFLLVLLGFGQPRILLLFCFFVGSGSAIFTPAWQSSVGEQVPPHVLTAGIAMNIISFNLARCIGPALGGAIVAMGGTIAAFGIAAALYVFPLIVLYRWRRIATPPKGQPERFGGAVLTGLKYVGTNPIMRRLVLRGFIQCLIGSAIIALMPLVSHNLLHAGPQVFGILLGTFGFGAVVGALNVTFLRNILGAETAARVCTVVMGVAVAGIAFSRVEAITIGLSLLAGAAWLAMNSLFNIGIQLAAPKWIAARVLAAFFAATCGGVAFGSLLWGDLAQRRSVELALVISGVAMVLSAALGRWLTLPEVAKSPDADVPLQAADPATSLPIAT